MSSSQRKLDKKSYARPALVTYGDVKEITKAVGIVSKNADGAKGGNNKTA